MQRRSFLAGLATVLAAPLAADAQQVGKVYRLGFLGNQSPALMAPSVDALREGLRELGWIEGQNISLEFRWAHGELDRHSALVAELMKLPVDVVIAAGTTAVRVSREATRTIPIVAPIVSDPVEAGLVASLARPGGNVTGLAVQFKDLVTKQLQILKEVAPKSSRVVILFQPLGAAATRKSAVEAARALGLNGRIIDVRHLSDLESAFKMARSEQADVLQVLPSPSFNTHRARLAELAAQYRLPAVYELREFVNAGGLMSYGPNLRDMYRRSAGYVDRVLKGVKPADLPIDQATTFELVINLKTAKALGISIPPSLLLRADHVIE